MPASVIRLLTLSRVPPITCSSSGYSTNQNPFDDPNENENPFASTATLPKPGPDPLSDREAALNAREAELARREREVAGLTPKNWPPVRPGFFAHLSFGWVRDVC